MQPNSVHLHIVELDVSNVRHGCSDDCFQLYGCVWFFREHLHEPTAASASHRPAVHVRRHGI